MKVKILAAISATLLMVSCNQKNNEATNTNEHMKGSDTAVVVNDSTMMDDDNEMMHENSTTYSCPMHPEVQGNLNDKCSKCGMKLTVPVAQSSEDK